MNATQKAYKKYFLHNLWSHISQFMNIYIYFFRAQLNDFMSRYCNASLGLSQATLVPSYSLFPLTSVWRPTSSSIILFSLDPGNCMFSHISALKLGYLLRISSDLWRRTNVIKCRVAVHQLSNVVFAASLTLIWAHQRFNAESHLNDALLK